MMTRSTANPLALLTATLGLLLGAGGCEGTASSGPQTESGAESTPDGAHEHSGGQSSVTFESPAEIEEAFAGDSARFTPETPFVQVNIMFNGPTDPTLEWRTDSSAGEWRSVEVTWSEEDAHVGRIILDEPATELQLRSPDDLTYAHLTFKGRVTARTGDQMASDLPRQGGSTTQALDGGPSAQPDAVVTRSEWGARQPWKSCGRSHDPGYITIHHTASPSNDGGDPARRLRQIQAYHIDNNGWCDIGYHYVVSQSGEIFEGRRLEGRTGAHVGYHNSRNLGVALIGNFKYQSVGATQFDATAEIVHALHETHDIPLNRRRLKGHTEWSGQSTSCPGGNMLDRLAELADASETVDTCPDQFSGTFCDDDESVHEPAIEAITSRGVASGCEAGPPRRFCPEEGTTRAQLLGLIAATLDDLPSPTRDYFSDDGSSPFESAANRLAEADVVRGCGNGKLCPDDIVSRAEAAVLLDRAYEVDSASRDHFRDDDGHWAESAIDDLAGADIIQGCASGEYCPDEGVTRAQTATLLCRANGWGC